jgi:KDO2-lipid IV(A) lauroyltransferase
LIAGLPLWLLHGMGTVLGWAMYGISPTYRRYLNENLAMAGYREASIRRAAIAHAGQMLAETPAMWLRPQARVAALVKRVEGMEAALAARARGKALLFLTPHMGCFEIAAQYAAQHAPITVLYRAPKVAWLEPLMREGRGRGGVRLVPADFSGETPARLLNRALEALVRECPEQYLWGYNRYKTPRGAKPKPA